MSKGYKLFIGLGSNLGDRAQYLERARMAMDSIWMEPQYSGIYETLPWGIQDQPCFLNQVGYGWTHETPLNLLKKLKQIEDDLGRTDGLRYGPRVIDLDILYYEQWVLVSDMLTIPHPRLAERAFALVPLAQLQPDFIHPLTHKTQLQMLQQLNPDNSQCLLWDAKTQ